MQFSSNFALVLALLSPLVDRSAAQDLMAMPQCGLECTVQSIGNTTCAATDMPCMCLDTVFTEATAACVTSHCGVLDALGSSAMITRASIGKELS
jgi:arginine deiminase